MTTNRAIRRVHAAGLLQAGVFAIIACGAVLRLRQYTFNRSLWYDEALLAGQVVEKSFGGLLDAISGAPFAFLAAAKLSIALLGQHDWALRLVPLIFGLASLELARRLADVAFRHVSARLLFVALCAFAAPLVFYASEFKPYSVDVAVALVLYLLGLDFDVSRPSRRAAAGFALIGAVCVWLSWASVFVLAAVGATLWLEAAIARNRQALALLTAIGLAWIVSFAASYAASLATLSGNSFLDSYWASAYAPSPATQPGWYRDSALGLVHLAFGPGGPVGMQAEPAWWSATTVVLTALVAAGFACLWKSSTRLFAFAAGSIAVTIVASGLHAYPFRGRLILFLVPAIFAALCALVDRLASFASSSPSASWARFAAPVLAIALVGVELGETLPVAHRPFDRFDIKGALEQVRTGRKSGDQLALSVWSKAAWKFYAPEYGLADLPVAIEIPAVDSASSFLREARERDIHGRIWIVFSHRFSDRMPFFSTINRSVRRVSTWEGSAAGAYLVEIGDRSNFPR